eukprot:scaffold6750_cov160-Amphora_coffeaeformis.AAC.3
MKRVLVTGGNKGIGKAICQRLLQEYSDVHVLLGSRNVARGEEAVREILEQVGPACTNRLELIPIDTASDESVQQAAASIGGPLYGIINNAGIMRGTLADVVNVNYFGPKRVIDALRSQLQTPGGRIVNIASASGPFFLQGCRDKALYKKLAEPWTTSFNELDTIASSSHAEGKSDPYGFSKALVNAYTLLLARSEPDFIINSVTPGWIKTDMTAGQGATNPPSKGAIPPVWCLMDTSLEQKNVPTGRYYGSDCVRSPLHVYRGPGDAPYEGPDGLEIQKKSTMSESK